MKTDAFRSSLDDYYKYRKQFEEMNPALNHRTIYGGASQDKSVSDKMMRFVKSQIAKEILERSLITLVTGDLVSFRHNWEHPDCSDITEGQIAIVFKDYEILGPDNQDYVGLVFLGGSRYSRTVGVEFLNKIQFCANNPFHVSLRKELKLQIDLAEAEVNHRHEEWKSYQLKLRIISETNQSLLDSSCC